MEQINLLPMPERKHKRRKIEFKLKPGKMMFATTGIMLLIIAVWTGLGMRLGAKQKQLERLTEQLNSQQATLAKLSKLKEDKEKLGYKLAFLKQQLHRDVLWSRKLNRLSDLVPPGVWLKNLTLQSKAKDNVGKYDNLVIESTAISIQGKASIDLMSEFITTLKEDQVFAKQFADVKLISSKGSQEQELEVMNFRISCQFP